MRNKINNYGKYLCCGLVLLMFASCNDWLDVEPKSQVKDKDLYSSESGFKEALAGVYSIMTQEYLYGKELTFGMLGVLAQEWDNLPTDGSLPEGCIYANDPDDEDTPALRSLKELKRQIAEKMIAAFAQEREATTYYPDTDKSL